jgi:hypothetical protein
VQIQLILLVKIQFPLVFPTNSREEHTFMVYEKRMLRRTFRPKRDKVTGGWRKLHNEEVHNLYLHQILLGCTNKGG